MSGMCVDVMSSALSTYHNEVFPFASTDDLNPMFLEHTSSFPNNSGSEIQLYVIIKEQIVLRADEANL